MTNAIVTWLVQYLADAFWSAFAIAAAAWVLARTVRRLGSGEEHRVWVGALVAQLVLPAMMASSFKLWHPATAAGQGSVSVAFGDGVIGGGMHPPMWLLTALGAAYAAVTLWFALRLLAGLWQTRQLTRQATPVELTGEAAAIWRQCCGVFGVRGAEVRVSADVHGPVTTGIWRKLLILPAGFLLQASGDELAAAMAHECAHMRRHDFAKNLLYQAMRLPLVWHPAVWFTLSRVTESREMVCDALAAETMPGRQVYAKALLGLAGRMVSASQHNVYAIGICDANRFEERVMRLIDSKTEMRGARRLVLAAVCGAAGLGTLAGAATLKMSVALPAMAQSDVAPKSTARVSGGVMAGNLLTKVVPVYPQDAKDAKVQGTVVLHAIIGKDGAIETLTAVSGPPELVPSAMDAVKQWVYKPYMLNGAPTEVDTTITVNYSLAK